ncbi:gluconolactonase [Kaistia soli DSM 19436]|uniref:Gluconolactonase n=1 Tax=Kaistia soli DSM 19436 TaxID=1122133 RepID=A0A1M5GCJ4_9HYPH|nr:SMP-30/gluconolactonase/LRE family protein [Kaistia soli]SHG01453.1 gluconolactonase [Kaistia soli DSM 19436]
MITHWFDIRDERFGALVLPNVHVDVLYEGGRWLEGPVYVPAARHLLFSDVPNDRVLRFDEVTGAVTLFQSPSFFTNGHTLDPAGRVLACEHQNRRVARFEHDGSVTTVADSHDGHRLNSPNDVIVARDGTVWFTDPTYGIATEYEGARIASEIGSNNVYRVGPDGRAEAMITDLVQPNGLALSPDESILYVADSGSRPSRLLAYPLAADGRLGPPRLLREAEAGIYDGFRIDRHGNIWTSAEDGVHCLAADGTLLGRIVLPEVAANVEFGGRFRNRLFICATQRLYAVYLNTTAAR